MRKINFDSLINFIVTKCSLIEKIFIAAVFISVICYLL